MTTSTTATGNERLPTGEAGELATRALVAALSGVEDEALVSAARAGHSPSARALVNASDLVGALASSVDEREPSADLRARLLASSRARAGARGPQRAGSSSSGRPGEIRAFCELLADQHAIGPVDEARRARIAALDAGGVVGGGLVGGAEAAAAADREIALLLERMAPFVPEGALFVSVVRGDQTIHRVHRGFPTEFGNVDIVPRFVSFCTHTVSANGTFVVHDASREAFFRRSTVATKFGARSYVGVPLRLVALSTDPLSTDPRSIDPRSIDPRSIDDASTAVGALCSINFATFAGGNLAAGRAGEGRRVPEGEIRFFEHCALHAEAIVAKVDTSTILRGDVYTEAFFRRLLAIELERVAESARTSGGARAIVLAFASGDAAGGSGFLGRIGDRVARLSMATSGGGRERGGRERGGWRPARSRHSNRDRRRRRVDRACFGGGRVSVTGDVSAALAVLGFHE